MDEQVRKLRGELREALAIIDLLAEADPTDSGLKDWQEGTERWYTLRGLVDPELLPKSDEEFADSAGADGG